MEAGWTLRSSWAKVQAPEGLLMIRRDTLESWQKADSKENVWNLAIALQVWVLGQPCSPFCVRLCPAAPGDLPFSIYKFGNAELSPAGSIGALHRGVAGDVITHVLHQLLQLGACGMKKMRCGRDRNIWVGLSSVVCAQEALLLSISKVDW
jgi:hypothetical protein